MLMDLLAHESVGVARSEMKHTIRSLSSVQCANIPGMQCGPLGVSIVYLYMVYTMDLPSLQMVFCTSVSCVKCAVADRC